MAVIWSSNMGHQTDLMDKQKCLITLDFAKSKTMLELARISDKYHQTVKMFIENPGYLWCGSDFQGF